MSVITTIEELRILAQKRVPRMFYDYADSGSWTESTYRANESDFQKIKLRQRVAVNMEGRSTASTMIGQKVAMPVAIAPTGLTGMQHADGEILAARAAKKFGIPFTLSTMSICSIEDVSKGTDGHPFWFQLYVMRDRDFIERLIERARTHLLSPLHHLGPAHFGTTTQRFEERLVCTAQTDHSEYPQHCHQTPLGLGHVGHTTTPIWQHRGPCQRR